MRHQPIDSGLFVENRANLKQLLPANSLAIVHANDVLPTNADGTFKNFPNTDLFYLSGVEQEESILLLFPDSPEPAQREILFVREPIEILEIWEGHKLSKEEATQASGVTTIKWLSEFPGILRNCMLSAEQVFLNQNEHRRAAAIVQTRDDRFVEDCQRQFPLHTYRRLAPLLHQLRAVKSDAEVELIRRACSITKGGFERLLKFVKPGVTEHEVEAELWHEFIRNRGAFAYSPIIASGKNACGLHYVQNDQICNDGDMLLLDVASNYANYNSDLTRTIPVNGRFTSRQRDVYDAVLRVMRASIAGAVVGKMHRDWHHEAQLMMNEELVQLGLLTKEDVAKHTREAPACKKYFMHGLGHPIGLDVHDVAPTNVPFAAGWVLTVEPGIYIPAEGFAVRLENDILITEAGPIDLMDDIPVEADEIEALMAAAAK